MEVQPRMVHKRIEEINMAQTAALEAQDQQVKMEQSLQ